MKTMLLKKKGEPLILTEVPKPNCGDDQIRIKVLTSGLNFADTLLINGNYQEKPELPFAPGMEICGIVDKLGSAVAGFNVGERVVSYVGSGGLSEFICVDQSQCIAIPDNISNEKAACLMIAYGSTELALNYKAKLQPTENLLVLGAGSGVGMAAIEIGKILGATVIAVARGQKKCRAAKLKGADIVIESEDNNIRDKLTLSMGADVIYDPIGGENFRPVLSLANPEARILPIGFASGKAPLIPSNIIMVKNITVIGFNIATYRHLKIHVLNDCFKRLINLCSKNLINPHISHVFPLEKANEALDLIRGRTSIGKVVIKL